MNLLGRLHFRTSYSQNVLRHCVEVAFLAGMLAEEMGFDGDAGPPLRPAARHRQGRRPRGRRAAIPRSAPTCSSATASAPEVVHAALGTTTTCVIENPYTVLVAAADACSASRPGARRETLERYIKRMEELESIAS